MNPLTVERGSVTRTWLMNFEPVNGIGPTMLEALNDAVSEAVADESVAAVVLASGLDVFSAGADAKWMKGVATSAGSDHLLELFISTMETFRDLALRLRNSPFLVIAAMNGHTLAGGLELAAACDLRFCVRSTTIKIGVPEMALFGQMPSGGGGAQFLARILGPSRALDLILDAGDITVDEAHRLGLVDRIVEPGQVLSFAQEYADRIAGNAGRVGVNAAKRSVFDGSAMSLTDGLQLDRAVHWDSVRRGRFAETVDAFVKKFA